MQFVSSAFFCTGDVIFALPRVGISVIMGSVLIGAPFKLLIIDGLASIEFKLTFAQNIMKVQDSSHFTLGINYGKNGDLVLFHYK